MGRYTDALNSGQTLRVKALLDYSYVEPSSDVIPFVTPEQKILAERRKILRQEWTGLDSIRTDAALQNEVLADREQEERYRDPDKVYRTTAWEYRRFIPETLRTLFPEEFLENTRLTLVDDVGVSRHFEEAISLTHLQNHPFRTRSEINAMNQILPLVHFGAFLSEFTAADNSGREKEIIRADVLTIPVFQS